MKVFFIIVAVVFSFKTQSQNLVYHQDLLQRVAENTADKQSWLLLYNNSLDSVQSDRKKVLTNWATIEAVQQKIYSSLTNVDDAIKQSRQLYYITQKVPKIFDNILAAGKIAVGKPFLVVYWNGTGQVLMDKVLSLQNLIRSSGEHLLELIGALLDVSRIDSGKLVLHAAPVDLAAELKAIADLYALRASSKGLGFEPDLRLGESYWAAADLTRVRQVLHNLLGNAMKFTKRGVIALNVWDLGSTFVCEVTDTGPGIDAKELPYIFDAFHQTEVTASNSLEGAGLGLTIARELARAMGGDLTVASTVGVGSRFRFEFKATRLRPAELPAFARDSTAEPKNLKSNFRVLVVEDNDVNALIAIAYLEQLGVAATHVPDGRQGVEGAFATPRPDLILMDCRMPVLDGLAATKEIRMIERSTNKARVPVIALTANPSDDDRAECYEAGMDGFLTKPFTGAQFMNAVRVYLNDLHEDRAKAHPLYEFAASLEDMDAELFGDSVQTVH